MYYATRVDSCSGIWFVNKTLKGFVKKFHDGDEILICKKKPDTADYGYYYSSQSDDNITSIWTLWLNHYSQELSPHPKKAINVMWMKRELGL